MVKLTEMRPTVLLRVRTIVALLLMAMVFAPAPEQDFGDLESGALRAEVLAAHVLTPTFDEGELTKDSGDSYEAVGRRRARVLSLTFAVLLFLASAALLLLARVRILRRGESASRLSFPPLGSRAPPLLRLV